MLIAAVATATWSYSWRSFLAHKFEAASRFAGPRHTLASMITFPPALVSPLPLKVDGLNVFYREAGSPNAPPPLLRRRECTNRRSLDHGRRRWSRRFRPRGRSPQRVPGITLPMPRAVLRAANAQIAGPRWEQTGKTLVHAEPSQLALSRTLPAAVGLSARVAAELKGLDRVVHCRCHHAKGSAPVAPAGIGLPLGLNRCYSK